MSEQRYKSERERKRKRERERVRVRERKTRKRKIEIMREGKVTLTELERKFPLRLLAS